MKGIIYGVTKNSYSGDRDWQIVSGELQIVKNNG